MTGTLPKGAPAFFGFDEVVRCCGETGVGDDILDPFAHSATMRHECISIPNLIGQTNILD